MKIILLPGLDGTGRLLADFAAALRREYEVEVIRYTAEQVAYSAIETWLEPLLPKEDHVIVAESFSGPLAIGIAAGKPPALRGVVLVASFARTPRKLPCGLWRALGWLPVWPALMARLSTPLVIGRFGSEAFQDSYRSVLREVPLRTLLARLCAVSWVDRRDRLPEIAVPLACLRATRDRLVPARASAEVEAWCAEVHPLDGPHFLLQARPEEAATAVSGFIARLG